MINFTRWTSAEEVVEIPPAFPMYTYSLTPMEQLPPCAEETTFFTDVIGVVTMLSNVSSLRIRTRQSESLKRTVTICNARDSGASLDVVLWGERATAFPAEQVHRDRTTPQTVIFVGALVKSYADNVSLSGGPSCKWYINFEVPEAKALAASGSNIYQPVKWEQHMASSEPVAFAPPEHKKVSDIKLLHPFKYKKTEWLVTVTVQKIDKSWWYNACKKCLKTARPFHDSFRCTEPKCGTIGVPVPRYKLCISAGDETGDTEFVIFGRIAQRLTRKPVDTLIADNPTGFIPDEVNGLVAQLDGDNALSVTPIGSQSSSLMLSRDGGSSMQNTPQKSFTSTLPLPPATSETSHASSNTPIKIPPLIPRAPATPESSNAAAKDEV
ncbi:replication protein A 70 kDa DNA-binding subunit D [Sorghum bicolor]|uniref:replication protein A 70 kDa DNA-binding subunit D n=1 Tax=Sorghum bicolor TaxID=4558 RepID=UPI000B42497F|nr:replication protein A 70 kDa DNA-binding subunit D [Sorghum bicolor]|eukprot:XP_021305518.1 replication protein A 70 kDa DNA-binding subunit D [Sorghum bicolor]